MLTLGCSRTPAACVPGKHLGSMDIDERQQLAVHLNRLCACLGLSNKPMHVLFSCTCVHFLEHVGKNLL